MNVAKRNAEHNSVVKHISHIQIGIAFGNHKYIIALVIT